MSQYAPRTLPLKGKFTDRGINQLVRRPTRTGIPNIAK